MVSEGTPGGSPTHPFVMSPITSGEKELRHASFSMTASMSSRYGHGAGHGSGGFRYIPNAALQASHKARSFSANALCPSKGLHLHITSSIALSVCIFPFTYSFCSTFVLLLFCHATNLMLATMILYVVCSVHGYLFEHIWYCAE